MSRRPFCLMASEYNTVDSAQIRALAAVQREDADYRIRYIFRWYSKTFSTPLHTVADLSLEDVLQAYYESEFEEMSADQQEEALQRLLETPEQAAQRKREKDAEDADNFDAEQMMAEHERKQKARKKAKKGKQSVEEVQVPQGTGLLGPDILPMPPVAHLPLKSAPEPEVSMRFVSDQQVAGLLAQDEREG